MQNHNAGVIASALEKRGLFGAVEIEQARRIAARLWGSVSSWIDAGNLSWDNETGNLRDSIACGIYQDGVLLENGLFLMKRPFSNIDKGYVYHGKQYWAVSSRIIPQVFNQPYLEPGINIVFRCVLHYGFFLEHGLGPRKLGDGDTMKKGYAWWSNELVPYINKEFIRIKSEYA